MAKPTCSVDGCERSVEARGLCHSHYIAWHRKERGRHRADEYHEITCLGCGATHLSSRKDGKYCSELCYHYDKWGARTCAWPRPTRKTATPKPKPQPRAAECEWCGESFTTLKATQRMCSADCKIKAKRVRRRGRQAGSSTHYTWAEVMRVFIKFDRCCAYCEQRIAGQPEPDHVVPLSKGGSNSITNILPACKPCNSGKRDQLLEEWASDRARRAMPPVTTAWAVGDPRVRHLTCLTTYLMDGIPAA